MKILLIGLGSIAKKHLKALDDLNVTAEVFALRSSADAPAYDGVTNVYDMESVPRDMDFAMICTPAHLHAQSVRQALTLGVPLFIEKPLVRHMEEIGPLINDIDAAGVSTYVACHLRHHPCLQFVQAQLAAAPKRINEVTAYCGSYMPEWVAGRSADETIRTDEAASGGVHLELIHELDYCTWLFGQPQECHSLLRSVSSLGIDPIDYAHYDLLYSGFTAGITLNYYRRDPKRELEIVFEDTTWTVDLLAFTVKEGEKELFRSDWTTADVYKEQLRWFLEHIEQGTPSMNSVHDAAKVLTLALS